MGKEKRHGAFFMSYGYILDVHLGKNVV